MHRKAAPKTPSRHESVAPLVFESETIAPGTKHTVELRVARLPSGAWVNMSVVIAHGASPGPTLWLSGALHGDELNGVAVIQGLLERLDPASLRGTVLAVPCVNGFGVTAGSRYLPDRRDLNRSFPGTPHGSLAARLAHLFFDRVVTRGVLGLDFHTGSNGRCNLPQIRCDLDDARVAGYARAFAPPVLVRAKEPSGSLRAAAGKRGIPVLVFEAGEALRFERSVVDFGVAGTLRVMRALDMIDDAPEAVQAPLVSHKTTWARATQSGFCMDNVDLGQRVKAGEPVASITDSVGSRKSIVRAKVAGLVIGVLRTAVVHRGDALVHIAELGAGE